MRVIAGSAKHTTLETVKGDHTRPTTDRIKETLFNMLQPYVTDADFLDLFAGSGQIGIEALSRGAHLVTFVENNKDAVSCIDRNLIKTHLTSCEVFREDVLSFLGRCENPYDVIFLDPPYALGIEGEVLSLVQKRHLLREDGLLVIEAAIDTDVSFAKEYGFCIQREKSYKTNKHVFLCKDLV